jgi:hypothetical protein
VKIEEEYESCKELIKGLDFKSDITNEKTYNILY